MSEWSDDDGAPVAPAPSTEAPPLNTRTEVQSKGGEGVPEQQAEERPTAGATRPLAQGTRVDPRTVPRCSGRNAGSEPSTKKLTCKYPCLGIICCPIFIVTVIDELI